MEGGHPNVWDCGRIFNDLKRYFRMAGNDLFGTFTVEAKESCRPLMIADMLGATHSMMRALDGNVRTSALGKEFAANPEKKGAKLSFLELQPDALRGLKIGFEQMRQRMIDTWRQQKAVKKGKASSSKATR
jgi:hypothetical protein